MQQHLQGSTALWLVSSHGVLPYGVLRNLLPWYVPCRPRPHGRPHRLAARSGAAAVPCSGRAPGQMGTCPARHGGGHLCAPARQLWVGGAGCVLMLDTNSSIAAVAMLGCAGLPGVASAPKSQSALRWG